MEHQGLLKGRLVTDCLNGDPEARRQLYELYSRGMYQVCLRLMNNEHDAEDMLQDAFYQVFKSLDTYRGEAAIGAWIKRIVVNKCLNELKKKNRLFVRADDLECREEEGVDEERFTYTVDKVKKAINELADGYRIVLSLFLFEDYSHRQIAETLGISESTAKTQYMRAKQRVRESVLRQETGY